MRSAFFTGIVLSIFLPGFIFTSCNNASDEKTLDFGQFTIEVPTTWNKVKLQGTDSYVGQIAIGETDTLTFDLGWYSSDLTEPPPFRLIRTDKGTGVYVTIEDDSRRKVTVREFVGMATDVNVYKFLKDTAIYATIDNRKAKIVRPKISGTGTTGVYFDSVWVAGSDNDRFQISGRNLNPENERLVLEAIKTLRFKRKED